MTPTRKDFRDAVQNLRWYLAAGPIAQPLFDRFDYKQKFEYWGLILGGTIMIASGFVLYFPMLLRSRSCQGSSSLPPRWPTASKR